MDLHKELKKKIDAQLKSGMTLYSIAKWLSTEKNLYIDPSYFTNMYRRLEKGGGLQSNQFEKLLKIYEII
jgi:hypothetical protein